NPRLYATFLLWLLSELFEELPEVGDPEKPRLVFFFDEAHLLFNDAPKVLVERVEQVVRLIRSKGVGVYFVTQNPLDVPETVLGQLGNRVQHALRAYTPREQKAVKTAAETFRPNPEFDCATVITTLGTGEALVSTLEGKGSPSVVERTLIRPPASRLGPLTEAERQNTIDVSPVRGLYDEDFDRESAYEILAKRTAQAAEAARQAEKQAAEEQSGSKRWTLPGFGDDTDEAPSGRQARPRSSGYQRETIMEAAMKSVARTVATQVGRAIVRGILGSLKR
ncbi:MAG TPA: helicase HerA-like domain-containing protein, partial [Sinorhizobium sp.]|nr:helicase HerA-like domain-containing protein [Sinorhizobium sp.]